MQTSGNTSGNTGAPAPMPDAPTDPYMAGLWQQWRTQLRLTMKTPWLATKWLEESRKLLERAGRIYTHLCRQPRPIRRRLQRQLGASLAGVALALALANAPVQAADFTANDAASLIAAINDANDETTNPGPDTITLTGDVTLTASYFSTYSGDTGLPLISSQITIAGAGHTIMRDAGAPAFRLLAVDSSGDLTLNAVTLRGGNASIGGAIHNEGTLAVNNSTLLGHHSGYAGGAIYNSRGTLALNESILSNNTSSRGGGFVNRYGTVTVSNSTISDNTAPNFGGGFRNTGGTVTVSNSTLSGNYAEEGGAVSNGGMLTISNSTISDNSANIGAAIYNDEGTLTLNNSTLSGNSASTSGGGIYNYGTVTLNHSLISGNNAGSGAEIYNYYGSTVNANNFNLIGYGGDARSYNFTPGANDIVPSEALAAILDTTLADNGGPSTGSGTATLTHALVTGSPAVDAAGDSGFDVDQRGITRPQGVADDIGAFEVAVAPPNAQINGSDCDLIDAIIAANTDAASGDCNAGSGADTITLLSDVTLTASNVNVYSSDTGLPLVSSQITIEGAGHTIARDAAAPAFRLMAVSSSSDLTLNAVTLSGGSVVNRGGAVYSKGTLTVNNSTISGNIANYGGGIYNKNGTLTVNSSTLSGNTTTSGGAFYSYYGTVTVNESTLSDNTATKGGGGFVSFGEGTVTVSNSIISGNAANNKGGGLYNYGGAVTIRNSTLSGNSATKGGGLYNYGGTMTVNESTLSANTSGNGGGLFSYDGTVAVNNSTLSANTSDKGGGLFIVNGTVTVRNSTLSGNAATNRGGGIYTYYGTVTLNRSLIAGNSANFGPEIETYSGTINGNNFNLIGHSGSARSSGFTPGANDIVPSEALATILDTTLADNGGPSTSSGTTTLTHALVSGSPAIDAAGDGGLDTDQRGVARPQGAADDIGAFEVEVAAAPEIDITGNGVSIASGDNEPDPADHTNFGSADIDGGTVVRTFTIHNTGDAELSGITVSVDSGLRAAAQSIETLPFSVTSAPATTVAAGESTEFQITFDPSEVGGSSAVVIIESNDADEGLYNFAIGGIGSERLLPNTHLAPAGAATQSCETGSAGYVYDCTVTFNLSNTSSSVIAIGHYRVNSISAHAYVLNGEPTPGQDDTIVQAGEFVSPGSNFQPEFVVGLTTAARYTIRYSVFGVANVPLTSASAGAGASATGDELVELGTFDITFEPGAEGESFQLYLPTVISR